MRVTTKNLTLRLNDAEYSQLRSIANERGLKIEPTIRRLIAEAEIKRGITANGTDLLLELTEIGKQINQIAHQANTQRFTTNVDVNRAVTLVQQAYTLIKTSL